MTVDGKTVLVIPHQRFPGLAAPLAPALKGTTKVLARQPRRRAGVAVVMTSALRCSKEPSMPSHTPEDAAQAEPAPAQAFDPVSISLAWWAAWARAGAAWGLCYPIE